MITEQHTCAACRRVAFLLACEDRSMMSRHLLPLAVAGLFLASVVLPHGAAAPRAQGVDYGRQVLPILSENCFACHGRDPKARKGSLRLDVRDAAVAKKAIAPGKPADSHMIERLTTEDTSQRMPPKKTGKHLTPEQVAVLRQWIEQGAPYTTLWSLTPPRKQPLPAVKDTAWPRNPVDYFILARLDAEGLRPSPELDRARLARRVSLDLTGLPPTPEQVHAFVADSSADAYEKFVDRLLESSRYGEHMARYWLDLARYGDTHGLHLDNYREMWLYRQWVIGAFNRNLPLDRFLVEQLAGDLLPGATEDQIIASGFNRCHVSTSEGGSIEEECYVRNVIDRVDTFGTAILGLSMGCCRCHDHKYDPFRMKDYYALFAFFNSLDESALDGNVAAYPPVLRVATAETRRAEERLDQKAAAVRKTIAMEVAKVAYQEPADASTTKKGDRVEYVWIDDSLPPGVQSNVGGPNAAWEFVAASAGPVYSGSRSVKRSGKGLNQNYFDNASPGLRVGEGDVLFAYVYLDPKSPPREIMLQWFTDGWKHRAYWGANLIPWGADKTPERTLFGTLPATGKWVRLEVEAAKVGIRPGALITGWAFTQFDGTAYWDKGGILTRTPQAGQGFDTIAAWLQVQQAAGTHGLPKEAQEVIKVAQANRTPQQQKLLRDAFIELGYAKTRPIFESLHRQLADIEQERTKLRQTLPATLVSRELPTPRQAFLLKRGEYDHKGDRVERMVPISLPPMRTELPRNRLGLAQWLISPEHPLTARVAVNHLWQQVFGTGLVRTAEDFGSQGEPPSHPELLDFLAVQFQEDGWDVKRMMKRLVTSATYRQTSRLTADRLARDPSNRLLSRGPRFRLDAEVVRDQALCVSGLLVEKLGGPSVKPPQPAGLWEAVGYTASNTARFTADVGHEMVHRRSMYTFWKRTSPPPQMNALDAPSRESCVIRRERTDTPLQALLLLNETQFVEAARALAERALREAGPTPEARITRLFELATCRAPDKEELAELLGLYRDHRKMYDRDLEAAKGLISVGETKPSPSLDPRELAAWTMVANLVLNLDEVLNKG
jgi:mono/diheme cytochrome c family protein